MSILDREAKIFRFLFESAVFEREFAAEVLSTTVNFQRFKMTPFNGEGPVSGGAICKTERQHNQDRKKSVARRI